MKIIIPPSSTGANDDVATVAVQEHRKTNQKENRHFQYQRPKSLEQREKPDAKYFRRKVIRKERNFGYTDDDDDASRIRRRFLYRLGLIPPNDFVLKTFVVDDHGPLHLQNNRITKHDSPSKLCHLKNNEGVLYKLMNLYCEGTIRPMEQHDGSQKVSFENFVRVYDIPNRHMYSERIKRTIWISPNEAAKSIVRNRIEYMAEGNDPSNVAEEKDFIWRDHKLVHPVCHYLEASEYAEMRRMYNAGSP